MAVVRTLPSINDPCQAGHKGAGDSAVHEEAAASGVHVQNQSAANYW
jgi:hypothetical protein